jgi:hypothetical protein
VASFTEDDAKVRCFGGQGTNIKNREPMALIPSHVKKVNVHFELLLGCL